MLLTWPTMRILLPLLLAALPLWGQKVSKEFIYKEAPFAQCHASTILEAQNGDMLAAWFGGTKEKAPDVAIWMSRRTADGWSAPVEMARHEQMPTWNPVLFRAQDGVTWLYYKYGPDPRTWTGAYRRSEDDGRTWSDWAPMPAGLLGPIKNKPLTLPDGTIISGTSVESHEAWASWAEISKDQGRTWRRFGPISHPTEPFGVIQPAVVPILGGIRMYMRTRNVGRIGYADSFDGGQTWSPVWETELPHPNSGIDAVGLPDGRIALLYNHTEQGRTPLHLSISADEGKSWKTLAVLEDEPGEYSYPAIIYGSDGALHMTYTWRRETVRYVRVEP